MLYCAKGVWNISRKAWGQENTHNKTMKQTEKVISTLRPGLCGDNLLIMIRLPQRSVSSQSLDKYWQLNQNNQETEHIQTQTNATQNSGPNKQQKTRSGIHTSWLSKPESESLSVVCAADAGTVNVVTSQLNGAVSDRHGFGDVTVSFCACYTIIYLLCIKCSTKT